MERRDRPAPEWEAPATLLPRVLAAVETELCPVPAGMHGWPFPAAIAVTAIALAVLAAAQRLVAVAGQRGLLAPWVSVMRQITAWLAAGDAIWRALNTGIDAIYLHGAVWLVALALGAVTMVAWLGAAIGFSYVLGLEGTNGWRGSRAGGSTVLQMRRSRNA